jgi:hypothetical protein
MKHTSRRAFLQSSLPAYVGLRASAPQRKSGRDSDVSIESVTYSYEEHRYRAPYKFGGVPVDRATILNVNATVRTRGGKLVKGFGSMPLGNVWSFPSREMPYNTTLGAMKALAERIAKITNEYHEYGHPIEINFQLEPQYLKAASEVSQTLKLAQPIPKLCTLVTASPFDAALHDAYGKALNQSCYQTYGRELMGYDLARYLNADFKGEALQPYINQQPRARISMFHSVGGADAVLPSELQQRLNDGLPETLAEWIKYNGLTHIKIKLQGEDLKWDIERTVNIDRVANETRPQVDWKYCVDFNER